MKDGEPVLAYVSYDKTLFNKYAVKDNVLWIVGLGPDGTPTLEARLAIETRFGKGDEGITVEGAVEGSSFYGLNNASVEIMKLVLDKFLWIGMIILGVGLYLSITESFKTGIWYIVAGAVVLVLFAWFIIKEFEFIR